MTREEEFFVKCQMDLRANGITGFPSLSQSLIRNPGLWIVLAFRIQEEMERRNLRALARIVFWLNRQLGKAEIVPGARIGGGLRIQHGLGMVVGRGAVIGPNATIAQSVTIGLRSLDLDSSQESYPQIGSDVTIGAGAAILGGVVIGNRCVVGANSVVLESSPDDCLIVGVPARIIRRRP